MSIPVLQKNVMLHTALSPAEVFERLAAYQSCEVNKIIPTDGSFWISPTRIYGYKPFIKCDVVSSLAGGSDVKLKIYDVFLGTLIVAFFIALFLHSFTLATLFGIVVYGIIQFMRKEKSSPEFLCDILEARIL